MTNLHVALQSQAEMVSFYGPAVITQFGEWPKPHSYTDEEFFEATQSTDPPVIEASDEWTDDKDNMDYVEGTDTGYHREYQDNPGYQWLHSGDAKGKLIGGCITSLMTFGAQSIGQTRKIAFSSLKHRKGRTTGKVKTSAEYSPI